MKTEIIDKLTEQYEILSKLKADAEAEFKANLVQLFEDNPTLMSFRIRVNNHEFNDGDPTYFGLYYEDVEVTDTDANIFERNDYECSNPDRNCSNPLVMAVYNLFERYDKENLYECLFGDEYGVIEVSRNNVTNI